MKCVIVCTWVRPWARIRVCENVCQCERVWVCGRARERECVPVESVLSEHPMIFGGLGEDPAGRPRPLHAAPAPGVVPAGQAASPGLLPACTAWGWRRPRGRNPENAAGPEALVKLFPDSGEAENPQASAFPDCQGHGPPAARVPLSAAPFWASAAAGAEGGAPDLTRRSSVPSTPGPADRVGRLDTPRGLGSGVTAFWTPLAGLTLSRCSEVEGGPEK